MTDLLGPALVQTAQGASALAWVAEAIYFAWIGRQLRASASPLLAFAVLFQLLGWTQAGFTVRWYIWHGAVASMGDAETAFWVTLYALSAIIAIALIWAAETYRRYST